MFHLFHSFTTDLIDKFKKVCSCAWYSLLLRMVQFFSLCQCQSVSLHILGYSITFIKYVGYTDFANL